jgi:hypothetical protein
MKSAYELAMERLSATEPAPNHQLSDVQKQELTAVEQRFKARLAEREIFLQQPLENARRKGDRNEESQILRQLAGERERFQEEMEAEKEAIRQGRNRQ